MRIGDATVYSARLASHRAWEERRWTHPPTFLNLKGQCFELVRHLELNSLCLISNGRCSFASEYVGKALCLAAARMETDAACRPSLSCRRTVKVPR
jgi:hypothetical protein